MPTLIVKRKREVYTWTQVFHIYINGAKIGSISNGQTEEFEIPDGEHMVIAKVYWCGSNKVSFSVSGDQEQTVFVSSFKFADLILLIQLSIFILHYILSDIYGIRYVIWLAIPFGLWSFYHYTFGYNKCLRIEEDHLSLSFK